MTYNSEVWNRYTNDNKQAVQNELYISEEERVRKNSQKAAEN